MLFCQFFATFAKPREWDNDVNELKVTDDADVSDVDEDYHLATKAVAGKIERMKVKIVK